MKNCLLIFLLIFKITLFAQTKDEVEIVSVVETQQFFLNSQSRIGGTTRATLFINLPPNTVSWIYMLTTSKTETPQLLNLLPQAIDLFEKTGFVSNIVNSLICPSGESAINTYLMSQNQFQNFISKNVEEFRYFPPASRIAFNSGKVKVDNPYTIGQYYIGLENPAAITGINIRIEVIAFVKKNNSTNLSTPNNKTGLQTVLETIQKSFNKSNNPAINKNETELTNSKPIIQEDSILKKITRAENYGSLGWSAFERGDLNLCIELTNKSISVYPLFFTKANLALCYLLQGKDSIALDEYINAIELLTKETDKNEKLDGAIKDIEDAKKKMQLNPVSNDILTLLKNSKL